MAETSEVNEVMRSLPEPEAEVGDTGSEILDTSDCKQSSTEPEGESGQTGTEISEVSEVVQPSPELEVGADDKGTEISEASGVLQPSLEPVVVAGDKVRLRPSSLRTRPSTRPKRTVMFKDDVEEPKPHPRPQRPVAKKESEAWQKVPPAYLGIFLSIALASLILYLASPTKITKPRLWTAAELAKYNGTNYKPPLLLGILGFWMSLYFVLKGWCLLGLVSVFDVSKGWNHYGPGGGYHHFVGRDASRAFVSGNFSGDGLTDSLEGLSPTQIKAIEDWRLFFVSRYIYLGKLIGTFYDEEGKPTKKLHKVEKKVLQAIKLAEQEKKDEDIFPNCNSRWTQGKGGEVWCNIGLYPRRVERVAEVPRKGPPGTRCACFEERALQRPGLQEYEGCEALSSKCTTS